MRGPEVADGERYVIQAPAHLLHLHGGTADRAPSELSVKLSVAGAVGGRQPQITLGHRQADRVPVDQEQLGPERPLSHEERGG